MTGVKYILDGELAVQKPSGIFKIMQCICSFTLACVTLAPTLTQDYSFAPLMVQMNLAGSCCFLLNPFLHTDPVFPVFDSQMFVNRCKALIENTRLGVMFSVFKSDSCLKGQITT